MEAYTALARQTVETYTKTGQVIPVPQDLPEGFYRARKGVFVTIYKNYQGRRNLRGCVGTFSPTKDNLAQEIIQSAIFASQEDDRFDPVTVNELGDLCYEVSLLEPPEQISSHTALDTEKYGVIVKTTDGRCGLLLPNIEGVDSPLDQIEIAARKGGIDIKREKYLLFRFVVTKYKE